MQADPRRALFERWATSKGRSIAKDSHGEYLVRSTREAWEVWQAALLHCHEAGGAHAR